MSAQYLLPCPHCKQSIPVAAKHAGSQKNCPGCKETVDVPKLGILRQYGDQAESGPAKTVVERSRTKGLLFSLGLIIAVLAGAGGAALYGMGQQRHVDVDVEAEIDKSLAGFDAMPPAQVFDEWANRPDDLGEWHEMEFIEKNREAAVLFASAYSVFAIGGIGLVMLLSSFAIKNPNPTQST